MGSLNELEAYLNHLVVNRNVSASTQSQALNALVFLYRYILEIEPGWLDNLLTLFFNYCERSGSPQ